MDAQDIEREACEKLADELAAEGADEYLVLFVRGWWRLSDADRKIKAAVVQYYAVGELPTVSPH